MLSREDFTPERVDLLIAEARKFGRFDALTHQEREESRQQFLQSAPLPAEGLWVFGYGSLLWNPAFHYIQSAPARLYGYRRHYCLHLTMGRGSPDKPGIMLALDTGGSCNGRAFLIEPDKVESETRILWLREMLSGAYLPRWVSMKKGDGTPIRGLTFVVNRSHSRYRDDLTPEDLVLRICQGEGHLGSSREYLDNTIAHLEEINVRDRYLHDLQKRVRASDKKP